MNSDETANAFEGLRTTLVLDALDAMGLRRQALNCRFPVRTQDKVVVGVAKTFLWMDFAHDDPDTYALELRAIDSVQPGEFLICAAAGSARSALWGELLTTAALTRGAVGLATDGGVRDVAQMRAMTFPIFAQHLSPYDSYNRQKVVAFDVAVEIGGVLVSPGDIIVADEDGVAVAPRKVAAEIAAWAQDKAASESLFRDAVRKGMKLVDAYKQFGVL